MFRIGRTRSLSTRQGKESEVGKFPGRSCLLPGVEICRRGDFVGESAKTAEEEKVAVHATIVDEPKACSQSYRLSCETRAVGSSS